MLGPETPGNRFRGKGRFPGLRGRRLLLCESIMPDRYQAESPLSATWRPAVRERAVLVGLADGLEEDSLAELAALARAAGAEPVGRVVQTRAIPDPATFVGKGKVAQIHDLVHTTRADAIILDDELSPGQLRNLEERLRVKVLDRTALILDIFALHARSGEGKLQVDRQHIRRRITKLRRDITGLSKSRGVKRARRERSGIPQVALAGYTNAGKSTLMNALTAAQALVADQPFATLDPKTRRLALPNGRKATLSDTVGFVRKLPHDLVEAFKSTLEEVARADLILHVADATAPDPDAQMGAVREVLGEIGAAEIPEVLALNKWDLLDEIHRARVLRRHPEGVPASALTGEGVEMVAERVAEALPRPPIEIHLLVPFDRSEVVPRLYRTGQVVTTDGRPEGTWVVARVPEAELPALAEFMVAAHPRRGSPLAEESR